jgi:hypothetical protein
MKYRIVVPSRDRAQRLIDCKGTLYHASTQQKSAIDLFVLYEELEAYKRTAETFGVGLRSHPDYFKNIPVQSIGYADTLDAIIDLYCMDNDALIIMDDDLMLYGRNPEDHSGYINFTVNPNLFNGMVQDLLQAVYSPTSPLASIQPRQFSQDKPRYEYNTRLMQVWAINCEWIRNNRQFTFRPTDYNREKPMFMSDIYFTLNTLTHGVKNTVLGAYVRNDAPQTKGGAYSIRNPKDHAESVKYVAKKFPELVAITGMKDNSYWKAGQYYQTQIKWKKAFCNSQETSAERTGE